MIYLASSVLNNASANGLDIFVNDNIRLTLTGEDFIVSEGDVTINGDLEVL